jgi:hypothetical protein
MRHIKDSERRARLAVRHGIHPDHRVANPLDATRAMTVLHATESASVYLSVHARADGVSPEAIDRALYADRSLIKQLAMRRTLFVFPRGLVPAALGSASTRVAAEQRRLIARDVEKHGVAADGQAWLQAAGRAVITRLAGSAALSARQLREELPELSGAMTINEGKKYGGTFQMAPRVLTLLGAEGHIVRGPNAGHWRTSRPTWTLMADWLGERITPLPAEEGYTALVRRWLGSTKRLAGAALAAVGAVEVGLDGGRTGWVLADDVESVAPVEPWAALLPTLDPTTMGWKEREFYLDPARVRYLFDSNGNGGATAWWDGRIVGAWVQDPDGVVQVLLCEGEDVGREGRQASAVEAARLTTWLDRVVITNVYKSQLMKQAPLP